ncbi:hypothetical protein ES703_92256 [subsurface metagenome]
MTVAETITTLDTLRAEQVNDLTVQECHALGVALCVLIALAPSQVEMIDQFLAMSYPPSN